ncbi:hypothetical protein AHAT_07590 [Agarivorans sp. Toyoura001]|nr:hypothetical protein AHAT_07590 [Agarivorans sp. Toyoura001]
MFKQGTFPLSRIYNTKAITFLKLHQLPSSEINKNINMKEYNPLGKEGITLLFLALANCSFYRSTRAKCRCKA